MSPEDISALKQTVARFVERRITPSMGAMEAAGEFPHGLIEAMGSAIIDEGKMVCQIDGAALDNLANQGSSHSC